MTACALPSCGLHESVSVQKVLHIDVHIRIVRLLLGAGAGKDMVAYHPKP